MLPLLGSPISTIREAEVNAWEIRSANKCLQKDDEAGCYSIRMSMRQIVGGCTSMKMTKRL